MPADRPNQFNRSALKDIMQKELDTNHRWVFGLKKGDRVWMAQEESITQTERFVVDFLDQVGPSEFESVEKIFVP